jgi:hypothetical protein
VAALATGAKVLRLAGASCCDWPTRVRNIGPGAMLA